ncbi:hypothetical protein AAG906_006008 [Vitis piasezkii]
MRVMEMSLDAIFYMMFSNGEMSNTDDEYDSQEVMMVIWGLCIFKKTVMIQAEKVLPMVVLQRFSFKSLRITLNGQYLNQMAPSRDESNGVVAGDGAKLCMPYWIRDIDGRLVKIETPQETELENSQHGQEDNFNAYRSMRDRMHPPHMSAPSCIVFPTEQLVIRPHIVPLLLTFHGMESENPYLHIKEFEEVCNTFQEGGASIDLMRLKLFPFTLKDKAKIWPTSLRPRSVQTWTDLQAEFLKKFFPTHRTNGLKRQISNFLAKENEKFYECWERYMEAINACPHHGFDTWLLVSYFYDGMSSIMKQLLETMCEGDFMSKNPEEAMDFLSYVAKVSRGWDEPNAREVGRRKSQPNAKGGMYVLNEDIDMKAKVAVMARRLEELEMKKCPTILAVREMFGDQANVIGQFKPNNNAPYGNTYNSNWRNHPNFSWKPKPPYVESTLNKRMDRMQNDPSQKIDNVQYAISRLTNLNTVQEKGKFPSQPYQNPKGIHDVEAQEGESSKVREVKIVITLRSGKEVDQPTSKPKHDEENVVEREKSDEIKGKSIKKDDHDSSVDEEPERIVIKEDMMKKHMPPPFP